MLSRQLKATAGAFFIALYAKKKTDSPNTARYKMDTFRKYPPPLKKLPPTYSNLQLHMLRAHLQMMLWKAAYERHTPVDAHNIRHFGWNVKDGGVVTPPMSNAPVAPHELLDVVSCNCSAARKAFSELLLRGGDACCRTFICRKTRERLTMMNDI